MGKHQFWVTTNCGKTWEPIEMTMREFNTERKRYIQRWKKEYGWLDKMNRKILGKISKDA